MAQKLTAGKIYNKERTKKKILDAVGILLQSEGFKQINIHKVSKTAGVDRKLIYNYFNDRESLLSAYLTSRDYFSFNELAQKEIIEKSKADHGKSTSIKLLEAQLDEMLRSGELRQIITWGLTEKVQALEALNAQRESFGEQIFSQVTDPYFKDKDKNIRCISAILISAIYYMTIHSKVNGGTICGIDISSPKGVREIKDAIEQLINWTYS